MIKTGELLMVIDDDEDIRELIKVLLEMEGYRVTTAADGLDAWQQLKANESPALILLDLMMPGMDGEQFLKSLRASTRSRIPVVIMSGHTAAGDKTKELEGNGCLMKPVELEDLLDAVHRFLPNQSSKTAIAGPPPPMQRASGTSGTAKRPSRR